MTVRFINNRYFGSQSFFFVKENADVCNLANRHYSFVIIFVAAAKCNDNNSFTRCINIFQLIMGISLYRSSTYTIYFNVFKAPLQCKNALKLQSRKIGNRTETISLRISKSRLRNYCRTYLAVNVIIWCLLLPIHACMYLRKKLSAKHTLSDNVVVETKSTHQGTCTKKTFRKRLKYHRQTSFLFQLITVLLLLAIELKPVHAHAFLFKSAIDGNTISRNSSSLELTDAALINITESELTKGPTLAPSKSFTNILLTGLPSYLLLPSAAPITLPTSTPQTSTPITAMPSYHPTTSSVPTTMPSYYPTTSLVPTMNPSSIPSSLPTFSPTISKHPTSFPSFAPSGHPSSNEMQTKVSQFQQEIELCKNQPMTADQQGAYEGLMEGLTSEYAPDTLYRKVTVVCKVKEQKVLSTRRLLFLKQRAYSRRDNECSEDAGDIMFTLQVEFEMSFESKYADIAKYSAALQSHFKDSKKRQDFAYRLSLEDILLANDYVGELSIIGTTTSPPSEPPVSLTFAPTSIPSHLPTISLVPTKLPSSLPKIPFVPTMGPFKIQSYLPSSAPTSASILGDNESLLLKNEVEVITIISVAMVVSLVFVAISTFCGYRKGYLGSNKWKVKNKRKGPIKRDVIQDDRGIKNGLEFGNSHVTSEGKDARSTNNGSRSADVDIVMPIPSLISRTHSASSGSLADVDELCPVTDILDEYKDRKLEYLRENVEENVSNADGMMSQALMKALSDDDDSKDMEDLAWGGQGDNIEIEASILCETNDWLKRKKDIASIDQRRTFMQEMLNKMVASVRYNIVSPQIASRTMHGCAAMLELPLACDLPKTALIVTGMRKMATKQELISAMEDFGPIECAAVASKARGFGLVRFSAKKSAQKAMNHYFADEILVQDVAVSVKMLCNSAASETNTKRNNFLVQSDGVPNTGFEAFQQDLPNEQVRRRSHSRVESDTSADLRSIL